MDGNVIKIVVVIDDDVILFDIVIFTECNFKKVYKQYS